MYAPYHALTSWHHNHHHPCPSAIICHSQHYNILPGPPQVSLFLIFFNVAHALTGGVSRVAALVVPRPHPALVVPPGARVDGSARRPVVSAALLDGPRVDRWHRRCGVSGPSPPPPALVVPQFCSVELSLRRSPR